MTELDTAIAEADTHKPTHRNKIMRSALAYCIDEAISNVFGPAVRDEENPYRMNAHGNYPALILVALYVEYGCDMEDLASELLIFDLRGRNAGRHPRIDKLYAQYRELMTSFFVRGTLLRNFKAQVVAELNLILSKL